MINHYITLGVCHGDSSDELKKAYRAIAKANHPDLHGNDPAKAAVLAAANVAYGVLGSPALRTAYNKRQKTMYGVCAGCAGQGFTYKQQGFNRRVLSKCALCKGAGTEKVEP